MIKVWILSPFISRVSKNIWNGTLCKNSWRLKAVNYCCKTLFYVFTRDLHTSLYCIGKYLMLQWLSVVTGSREWSKIIGVQIIVKWISLVHFFSKSPIISQKCTICMKFIILINRVNVGWLFVIFKSFTLEMFQLTTKKLKKNYNKNYKRKL